MTTRQQKAMMQTIRGLGCLVLVAASGCGRTGPCTESAQVVGPWDGPSQCQHPEHTMRVTPMGDGKHTLVECFCRGVPVAPAASSPLGGRP